MAGYDGSGDPMEHLIEFDQMSLLHRLSDYIKCRVLVTTFKGAARKWFSTLPPDSVGNYDEFARLFTTQFASSIQTQKSTISLFTIKQGKGESLKMFVQRFNKEVLEVPSASDEIKAAAFAQGLQEGPLFSALALDPEMDYKRLQWKAGQYIQLEEALIAKRGTIVEVSGKSTTRKAVEEGREKGRTREAMIPKRKREEGNPRPWALYDDYNELKEPLEEILNKIKRREGFQWPRNRSERPQKRAGPNFCDFHNDYGHRTEKCGHLKDEIERMAREGKINDLLVYLPPRNLGQSPNRDERRGGMKEKKKDHKDK